MNKSSTNIWAVAEKYGIFIIFFIAILVFACIAVMNRFSDGEEVVTL